jgi:LPXTG-site transpeptidase (sortase) family protein
VDSKNQLQTARNLYDVGWYENSSKPGDAAGAILIDGHDLGYTTTGVFYNLKKLTPGDKIQIRRGDNQTFNFSVVSTKTYDANNVDMNAALVSVVPGKLGLNLITCTGDYDAKKVQFQQRLIVFAVAD